MEPMSPRVIPIAPWSGPGAVPTSRPPCPPQLQGDAPRVVEVLKTAVARALADTGAPAEAANDGWLASLKVQRGEAWVALQPLPPTTTRVVAQAAFETLRRLLPDTDIFVGAAPRH